jgi:hypothetical protein
MIDIIPYFIVFILGLFISNVEILFGKYHLNYSLILKRPKFILIYGLFYGIVGILILILIHKSELKINKLELTKSPFILAIIIGITIKPISRINLYTFNSVEKPFHIGFKQISGFFDNLVLKRISDILDEEIIRKVKEVKKRLNQKPAGEIDRLIEVSLPSGFIGVKRAAFMKEIIETTDKFDKLRYFAVKFGVHKLDTILILNETR